jgi:predicted kinase
LLGAVQDWTLREYDRYMPQFEHRYAEGRVRECHGDLHAGNIALIDGAAIPFDCIEFNPALRWMDVMSEAAFLMMDLEAHGHRDLAFAFLNAYLETSGDYAGVRLLPFYYVYRAVVRAKINLIRAVQTASTPTESCRAMIDYRRYITLAATYTRESRSAIVITHGFSGSGKTTLTRPLLGALGAVRVRSDIERKRRHGLNALAWTGATAGDGAYTDKNIARTYEQLLEHARVIAGAGFPVIVDATFLRRAQRTPFQALAAELAAPFAIVDVTAEPAELRARVAARAAQGGDASEATLPVLQAQLKYSEALTDNELRFATEARSGDEAAAHLLCENLAQRLRHTNAVSPPVGEPLRK